MPENNISISLLGNLERDQNMLFIEHNDKQEFGYASQ